ncbi:MAG TPA: Spy/CpxP family protein refolding chaperone [Syntrophorhabdaceae bacterium]|nr:Spy/CpxP family protein refolding chaperone [Syntrophorhabdaceae bacterium]
MTKLFAFFLLVLLYVPPVLAQDSYSDFERGLDLSEPQRTQIKGIRNKYIGEWNAITRESVQKRLELKELDKHPQANAERIGRLQTDIRELETSRDNIYHQYRSEVSRTLNERQRERYDNFLNNEDRRIKLMGPRQPRRYGR